jgi:hypothetical protein
MPQQETIERARKAKREGKAPSTQAGEFVRETIEDIRKGKHGARSTKQAIAIGLSKARRAKRETPASQEGQDVREDPAKCGARLSRRPKRTPQD